MARGIREEQPLTDDRKKHYLQNFIYSIPLNVNLIVIFHLLVQNSIYEKCQSIDVIDLLKEYKLYDDMTFRNPMVNQAKNDMLKCDCTKKAFHKNSLFMAISKQRVNNQNDETNENE